MARFKCIVTIVILIAVRVTCRDCLESDDCSTEESCCNFLCVPGSSCVGRDCSKDGQCGTGEHCCEHKCSLGPCDSCSSSDDCDSGTDDLICCNKACVTWSDCDGSLCSTDSDCDGLDCCGGWCTYNWDDTAIDCTDNTPLYLGLMCGCTVVILLGVFLVCLWKRNGGTCDITRTQIVVATSETISCNNCIIL